MQGQSNLSHKHIVRANELTLPDFQYGLNKGYLQSAKNVGATIHSLWLLSWWGLLLRLLPHRPRNRSLALEGLRNYWEDSLQPM